MIQYIACDIRDKMLSTGYINIHHEYAEIKQVGEDSFPMQYIGEGAYKNIFDIDVNGHSYLRKIGKMNISPAPPKTNIKTQSCGGDKIVEVKFPLRLVVTVPKGMLGDDAYSDDYLVMEIIQMLGADIDIPEINAINIEYLTGECDTDAVSVWRSEVSGPKHQMNFNLSYIAVNFTAKITISQICLIDDCSY